MEETKVFEIYASIKITANDLEKAQAVLNRMFNLSDVPIISSTIALSEQKKD